MDEIITHDETSNDHKDKEKKRSKKDGKDRTKGDKVKGNRKKPVGPMHFTANNEPRALEVLGDLDPSVFEEVTIKFSCSSILHNRFTVRQFSNL